MIDAVLSKLQSLRLTVVQWVGVTAAAVIGLLVMALKIQGSRVHSLQVKLLEQDIDNRIAKGDDDVAAALAKYNQAKEAYKTAGGTL